MLLADNLTHWWKLDDDGVWADDVGSWSLSEGGGVIVSGVGPAGEDVANFDDGEYLDRSNVAWDGAGDEISVAIWFKADVISGAHGNWLFSWRDATGADPRICQIYLETSSGKMAAGFFDSAGNAASMFSTTSPGTSGWNHAVITRDGDSDHRLYLNGSNEASDTTALSGITGSSIPFAIGTSSWAKGNSDLSHDGKLWGCGVWDRALSAGDVTTLYNAGSFLDFADFPTDGVANPRRRRQRNNRGAL